VQSFYSVASTLNKSNLLVDEAYNFGFQLGRTIGGTSDIFTVAARTLSGTQSAIATLNFYDLT
jgi:hypothetical protein